MAFLSPNPQRATVEYSIPNVTFKYCWEHSVVSNKYLKALQSYIYAWNYMKSLPHGANVLLLGMKEFIWIFRQRKDLNLYFEITEHPELNISHNLLGRFRISSHKRLARSLNHIFVISTALQEYYVSNGVDRSKVSIVNMTVDPNRFVGLKKSETKERYIAYCGTASNNKDGVDELIRAFAITHQAHPDIKLYIIGDTPSKHDQSGNLKLIQDLKLKESIRFTGIVSSNDMPQLLKDAAVLALDRPDSLQAKNGFPTKLGEYLLTGNPVVVTKVGDIPLFLIDNETALLCEERNPKMFASKLNWALEHPDEAEMVGEAGRLVALAEFDCIVEGEKIINTIKAK